MTKFYKENKTQTTAKKYRDGELVKGVDIGTKTLKVHCGANRSRGGSTEGDNTVVGADLVGEEERVLRLVRFTLGRLRNEESQVRGKGRASWGGGLKKGSSYLRTAGRYASGHV